MFATILPVIAPLFICVLAGYLWKSFKQPFDTQMVSRLVTTIGAPALIISTLSKTSVSMSLLYEMLWVCGALILVFLVSGGALLWFLRMDVRGYIGTLAFPNVGNMGLPVCLFAFGEQGLALGLAVFMVFSLVHFSFGLLLFSGESIFKVLLTNPIIYSVLIAVAMVYTEVQCPQWLIQSIALLGSFTIPMMLLTLGVSLAGLKISYFKESMILASLRLLVGFVGGWLVAEMMALDGLIKKVVILQAVMPTAVFNYMFASRYNRNSQQVAGMVLISTLLGFITLPGLLLWLTA